jgi:cytochrome c biogenesis protein CcdA
VDTGGCFPEIKQQGREPDYSPPSSAEVKSGGDTLPLPIVLLGVVLNSLSPWITLLVPLHISYSAAESGQVTQGQLRNVGSFTPPKRVMVTADVIAAVRTGISLRT